jgi:hypothetical protein
MGRRLSLAMAGGTGLGLLFYWIGQLVLVAAPTAPSTAPIVGLAVGYATATTIALAADLEEASK